MGGGCGVFTAARVAMSLTVGQNPGNRGASNALAGLSFLVSIATASTAERI